MDRTQGSHAASRELPTRERVTFLSPAFQINTCRETRDVDTDINIGKRRLTGGMGQTRLS
jgi:hypothetical protein